MSSSSDARETDCSFLLSSLWTVSKARVIIYDVASILKWYRGLRREIYNHADAPYAFLCEPRERERESNVSRYP